MKIHNLDKREGKCPKGKCTDCSHFISDDPDPKKCHCKVKKGYVTQNALRHLACWEFRHVSVKDCFDKDGYIIHDNFRRWKEYMKDKSEKDLARLAMLTKTVGDSRQRAQRLKEDMYKWEKDDI